MQVKKFMVGYEMLAQSQRDLTAEQVGSMQWQNRILLFPNGILLIVIINVDKSISYVYFSYDIYIFFLLWIWIFYKIVGLFSLKQKGDTYHLPWPWYITSYILQVNIFSTSLNYQI